MSTRNTLQPLCAIGRCVLLIMALAGCAGYPADQCRCASVVAAPTAATPTSPQAVPPAATPAPRPTQAPAPDTDLQAWLGFAAGANALTPAELATRRRSAGERFRHTANADDRLRFAYLLSRPAPTGQNLDRSRELLLALPAQHRYAPLRDLILRELDLTVNLSSARNKVRAQQAQLEALKAIEADLTENQKELEQLAR